MSPPTEQLIRDYLNRLSVAARDRLGPDDRRALIDRTRKLIERRADFAGRPTTLEVGKVLARLGDPAVLVEQEWRRLAAVRRDLPAGTPEPAGTVRPAEPWELAESAERGSGRSRFLARVLRREPGRLWRVHSGWPTAVASENGLSHSGDEPVRNGTMVAAGMAAADTGQAEAGHGAAAAANGTSSTNGPGGTNGASDPSGAAAFATDAGDELGTPAGPAWGSEAVRLLRRLASAAWQQPLEATAIILLGLGGVLFPPVFLVGAAVALGSRLWHYREKWVGLVLPPLLTIIGVAAGVAIGGRGHGLHDAWVSLNIVSRIAALLGAGYLAWRTGPGRRPPPEPPWNRPHRAT